MTLFEILNFNRELLERLAGTGYKPDDYKYIDLYKEYEQMRRKGEKVTYCVASSRPDMAFPKERCMRFSGGSKRNVRSMQYEKSGIFAFMGRRDELCIRNINTLTRQNDYSNEKVLLQPGPASFCGTEAHVRIGVQKSLEAFQ